MSKLIIITGISGSGKSTISNIIYNYYENSTLISMDTLKENIYELIGFYNYGQKKELTQIIYDTFISLLTECMNRNDENIIIEYPFNKSWEDKFKELITKYNYDALTIRVKGMDYDSIYKRLEKRNNSAKRHPSHSLKVYNPKVKENYTSTNELDYKKLKEDYENDKYTSINLGKTIDFINDGFNFEKLISKIDDA